MLRKEPNGQEQEPSGHRSVKIKDLHVSWKWPVCKIFCCGKDVQKTQYQSQLQQHSSHRNIRAKISTKRFHDRVHEIHED